MGKRKSRGHGMATGDSLSPARLKAELLCSGGISVSHDVDLSLISRSAAGPSAGSSAVHIELCNKNGKKTRLRLRLVDRGKSPYSLRMTKNGFAVYKNGHPFARRVRLLPKFAHSPTHAFYTLDPGCEYRCAFCNSPGLGQKAKTDSNVLKLLDASMKKGVEAVALTCGVVKSPAATTRRLARLVRKIRKKYPGMPIGIETYAGSAKEIAALREAGADELKLNIQSFDPEIFRRVCPDLDYDRVLALLGVAAERFGRGKVASNIIIGLGEGDGAVLQGTEILAAMGVVANIRKVAVDDGNRRRLQKALGRLPAPVTPHRLLRLAVEQKRVLKKHGLTTKGFRTMCHNCACCDIEPFVDV